jgi:cytochrome c oxidase assembly protein subunit 15
MMTAPPLQRKTLAAVTASHVSPIGEPGSSSALRPRLAALAAHLLVALIALVGIGGATRVMEAGLACPDWPLCYGSLLPGRQMNLQVFLEWFHRLDAFVVGVGLLVLTAVSWWERRQLPAWLPPLSTACVLLVAVQGGLGALTVLQLLPSAVVTAHLLTALLLVALLSACHQGLRGASLQVNPCSAIADGDGAPQRTRGMWSSATRATLVVALVAVLVQCLLGGLMASQWAAARCISSGEACGWLLAHRLGARLAGALVLALAALLAWRHPTARPLAGLAALLVLAQIGLGVFSLRLSLALPGVTVAHQISAALLVAVLSSLTVRGWRIAPNLPETTHG